MRDRLIGRALSEGYRAILPHGVYPAALLFIETPLEEVDVNVHPAKTEVRFRRSAAVADAVREAVRGALASAGYARPEARELSDEQQASAGSLAATSAAASESFHAPAPEVGFISPERPVMPASQPRIEFSSTSIDPGLAGVSPATDEGSGSRPHRRRIAGVSPAT